MSITVAGGQVGDIGVSVVDAPSLPEVGTEFMALLFVFRSGSAYWHGATVFVSIFGALSLDAALVEHFKHLVSGQSVPPVRVGERNFQPPTFVAPASWGQVKAGWDD